MQWVRCDAPHLPLRDCATLSFALPPALAHSGRAFSRTGPSGAQASAFTPLAGEKVPKGRMRGPFASCTALTPSSLREVVPLPASGARVAHRLRVASRTGAGGRRQPGARRSAPLRSRFKTPRPDLAGPVPKPRRRTCEPHPPPVHGPDTPPPTPAMALHTCACGDCLIHRPRPHLRASPCKGVPTPPRPASIPLATRKFLCLPRTGSRRTPAASITCAVHAPTPEVGGSVRALWVGPAVSTPRSCASLRSTQTVHFL